MTFNKAYEPPVREPLFNVPGIILGSIAVLVAIHVMRVFMLTSGQDVWVLYMFGFVPAKFQALVNGALSGFANMAATALSIFSYNFLHGDWMHLFFNCIWMLIFGTVVARRTGIFRFIVFSLICGVGGVLLHTLFYWGANIPVIGASAVISGHMAAALRFMFNEGLSGPLSTLQSKAEHNRLLSVKETFQNQTALFFIIVWFLLNIMSGVGLLSPMGTENTSVAWQAHIGGFVTGLVLYSYFDGPQNPRKPKKPHLYVVH